MKKVVIMTILIAGMTMLASAEYVTPPEGLRLRKEPSLDAEIIQVLPFGTEVEGTVSAGWMKTDDGYLKAEYLSEDDPLDGMTAMGSWLTTAYTHTGMCCADGSYPQAGYSVATNSLPLGTKLFIQGVGFRTVTDRGPSSMPGSWLDIFMDGYGECVAWGEQYREVWVVE